MRYKEFATSLSRYVFRVAPNRGGELYTDQRGRQSLIKTISNKDEKIVDWLYIRLTFSLFA